MVTRWMCGVAAALLTTGCGSAGAIERNTCVAPANPGGGWDFTCRAVAAALGSNTPQGESLHVRNVAGKGGGIAFERVVDNARANESVIVAAGPSTLLGIAQNQYSTHAESDVRWLAALDAEPSVIAVAADAPWHTLGEFVRDWRAHPEEYISGGSSAVGGQDHMKMLLLARAADVDVRKVKYRPLNSAPDAVLAVKSGSIHVYPGDVSKVLRQVQRKEVRLLAVLAERRSPGLLADIPTAREQGYDLVFVIWRGLYAPPGISETAYENWVERLRAMSGTPQWHAALERNGLSPFFLGGREFETFVADQIASYRKASKDIGLIQ